MGAAFSRGYVGVTSKEGLRIFVEIVTKQVMCTFLSLSSVLQVFVVSSYCPESF